MTPVTPPALAIDRVLFRDQRMPLAARLKRRGVWALLQHCAAHGWAVVAVSDGDGGEVAVASPLEAMERAFNLDEVDLFFRRGDGHGWARVVLHNDVEDMLSDWGLGEFDAVIGNFDPLDHL